MEFNIDDIIRDSTVEGGGYRSYRDYDSISMFYNLIDPEITLSGDRLRVFLNFKLVDNENLEQLSRSSMLSTKTSAILFSKTDLGYDINKVVHDFTFGCLTRTTDVALRTFIEEALIPTPKRRLLERTPDYMVKQDNTLFLVEFGTYASTNRADLEAHYDVKMDRYVSTMDQLREYLPYPYHIFVIIVGPQGVVTNMNLPQDLKTALVYRMRLSRSVDNCLYDSGMKIRPLDQSLGENVKKFMSDLNKIVLEGEDEYSRENFVELINDPVDRRKMSALIDHCWRESVAYVDKRNWFKKRSEGKRGAYSRDQMTKLLAEHMLRNQNDAPDGFSSHRKSVVNAPMVVLRCGVPSLSLRDSKLAQVGFSMEYEDAVLRLWSKARDYINEDPSFIDNSEACDAYEDLTQDPEYLQTFLDDQPSMGPKPSDTRNLYSRVKLDIPRDDAIELAKVGIQGKKFDTAKEPAVVNYRKSRQLPLSFLDTDTSDIDTLMASDLSWMIDPKISRYNQQYTSQTIRLIQQAHSIHGVSEMADEYDEFLKEITCTPIFQWASWISDIAFELCLALRQSCKKDVFIVKKLKNFQCYILIKPVRLSSKIFFSLLWFNKDEVYRPDYIGNVFRVCHSNKDVSWTDFVSLDQCKIENWALAESRTLAMIPYWLEFHDIPPFQLGAQGKKQIHDHIHALQMMLLYTLIEIADKSEIEQEATLFRFMFMKSLTAKPLIAEPELVIKKFKTNPRSRLTIWIQRKLTQYCVYVAGDNIEIHQEDLILKGQSLSTASTKRMMWKGLINPYNGAFLKNPGDAINIMYIGYVQNKNLQPEANVFGSMLKKILALEDDFTEEIEARIGREDKPIGSGTKHEYNVTLLKEATLFAKNKFIRNLHGPSGLAQLIEDTVKKIVNTNIEEVFSTLKASSNFSEKFFEITEEEYHRAKIIEKAQLYVHSESTKVIDILFTCYEEVRNNGYMRIDIFQKNQHGGIREIYVLGFAERVVQWFLETLSRGLCSLFPGETMTHPENKRRLPEEYFKNLRVKNGGRPTLTVATSSDASKWSQNMYPHKFAVMLCLLLPDYLHPIIWNSMAFWKNKYIMIPQSLLKRMHADDNMLFYNEYMEGLYKSFKGTKAPKTWAGKDQAFIKVRTGMMQGILHYTSSLFHSVINVYIEALSMKYFRKITGVSLEPLTMQSSDDSVQILSCEIQDTNLSRIGNLYSLAITQVFRPIMGQEVGIQNSEEKLLLHAEQVFEFNSAFHFGPSRYESDIKMLSSSLICTDRENMMDRHMEQYTQLGNFINSGGTIYAANYIQMAQAFFNYRLLGSSVTSRFSLVAKALSYLPDPNLGFFALDNVLFTGLCGYKYNFWKIVSTTPVGKTYKYYLNEALTPLDGKSKPDLVSTKSGNLSKRSILGFGNRQKLLSIIERMELPEDWQQLLDNDPALYFRVAKNETEFKIKCALKMFSPGVQESLSTGNITTRIMASSAYITISTVMRSLGDWQTKEKLNLNEYKLEDRYNLLQLISHELRVLFNNQDDLSRHEMNFLFPYQEEYLALEAKLSLCDYNTVKPKFMEYRRVVTEVRVFERDNLSALPPDRIMSAIWFRDNDDVPKPRYAYKYIEECHERLNRVIPWLSASLEETLKNGPFEHINSLAAWLSQYHQKDKVVVIIGAPIVCRRGSSSILAVIRQNFHKHYEIQNKLVDGPIITSSDFNSIKQSILMAMSFPMEREETERRLVWMLTSDIMQGLEYNPSASKSRYNILCIMRDALQGSISPIQILERIAECRVGIVGGYTFPQRLDLNTYQYCGKGTWSGKFYDRKVLILVNSYYEEKSQRHISYVERIITDDIFPSQDLTFCIRVWLEENHMLDHVPKHLKADNLRETRTVAIRYARRSGLTAGVKTYYTKGRFCDDQDGIPIIIDKDITMNFGRITKFKIDVPMDPETAMPRGVIRLLGEVPTLQYDGRDKWVTLARYIVHHKDYEGTSREIYDFDVHPVYKNWIHNKALEPPQAAQVINHAKYSQDPLRREHFRDVIREGFSKKGYRLGKKRDEMPLMKTAYSNYVDAIEVRGEDPKKKVPVIPLAKDLFKFEAVGKAVEDEMWETKKTKTEEPPLRVRWADEEEEPPSKAELFPFSTTPAIDQASLMADKESTAESESEGEEEELVEEEEDDEDIDWGSDTECMELIHDRLNDINNIDEEYKAMELHLREAEEVIAIETDFDFGLFDEEMDQYLGDQLFRDLEMFNSLDYHISQSTNETNMRTALVKKEHLLLSKWISKQLEIGTKDFDRLFQDRIITPNIKSIAFMSVMDYIYPGVEFRESSTVEKFVDNPDELDPFM